MHLEDRFARKRKTIEEVFEFPATFHFLKGFRALLLRAPTFMSAWVLLLDDKEPIHEEIYFLRAPSCPSWIRVF